MAVSLFASLMMASKYPPNLASEVSLIYILFIYLFLPEFRFCCFIILHQRFVSLCFKIPIISYLKKILTFLLIYFDDIFS